MRDPIPAVSTATLPAEAPSVRDQWRALAHAGKNTAEATVLYQIAGAIHHRKNSETAGFPVGVTLVDDSIRRLKQAFTPVTNTVKLANGRHEFDTLEKLVHQLVVRVPESGLDFSEEQLSQIRGIAKGVHMELRGD